MNGGTLQRRLLVVEDSDEDFAALRRAMEKLDLTVPVRRCTSGDECLAVLNGDSESVREALPALILMDLNLPGTDGRDALKEIKSDPRLRKIPVIILTTSSNPRDIQSCYDHGANAYIRKPIEFNDMLVSLRIVADFWLRTAVLP